MLNTEQIKDKQWAEVLKVFRDKFVFNKTSGFTKYSWMDEYTEICNFFHSHWIKREEEYKTNLEDIEIEHQKELMAVLKCVPEEDKPENEYTAGWNDCRRSMLENLAKLK